MAGAFGPDTTTYAPFVREEDADGRVWLYAIAHGTLTAKNPYFIIVNEFGQVTAALSDVEDNLYVGFPGKAWASGDMARLQIGGPIDDAVTPSLSISVGHAVTLDAGAIADAGADYTGSAGEFAVCRTVSTSSTTQDLMLVPERFLTIS